MFTTLFYHISCFISGYILAGFYCMQLVMQSKKKYVFFNKKTFKKRKRTNKNVLLCFFIIIYNLKAGKCFLILWSAYSCYIQVVKHYIQHVNCIFIDSETNYLMNYNTNLHSNVKLHNYNLKTVNLEVQCPFNQYIHKCPFK